MGKERGGGGGGGGGGQDSSSSNVGLGRVMVHDRTMAAGQPASSDGVKRVVETTTTTKERERGEGEERREEGTKKSGCCLLAFSVGPGPRARATNKSPHQREQLEHACVRVCARTAERDGVE